MDGAGSQKRNTRAHDSEESDDPLVLKKRPNNQRLRAEGVEGRGSQLENDERAKHIPDTVLDQHP
jgi:hypothetical protein